LRVFQNLVLRKDFGPQRDEVTKTRIGCGGRVVNALHLKGKVPGSYLSLEIDYPDEVSMFFSPSRQPPEQYL
jgi:hypothetical protein